MRSVQKLRLDYRTAYLFSPPPTPPSSRVPVCAFESVCSFLFISVWAQLCVHVGVSLCILREDRDQCELLNCFHMICWGRCSQWTQSLQLYMGWPASSREPPSISAFPAGTGITSMCYHGQQFYVGARDQTQAFMQKQQALYQRSHHPLCSLLFIFSGNPSKLFYSVNFQCWLSYHSLWDINTSCANLDQSYLPPLSSLIFSNIVGHFAYVSNLPKRTTRG